MIQSFVMSALFIESFQCKHDVNYEGQNDDIPMFVDKGILKDS